jgi:thiamine biosynthesis lipoprotein
MSRLEALTSFYRRDSDAARLSAMQGDLAVAPETLEILAQGLEVGKASDGAFDMTLGRLKALWGFGSAHPRLPAPSEIEAALAASGQGVLAVADGRVIKRTNAWIDLGGIAKGYIIDRAVAVLKQAGVTCAAVNAGGDLRLIGQRAAAWRIGIRHPRQVDVLLATLVLKEPLAVVTSGDYERFFEQNGVRYHHLFDPTTGMPARRCQSVTVVSRQAVWADALATAVFVLGPEQGLALLERYPQTWGLIVAADGTTAVSPGLREQIAWP